MDDSVGSRGFMKGARRAVFTDSVAPLTIEPPASAAPIASAAAPDISLPAAKPVHRRSVGKTFLFVFVGLILAGVVGYSFSIYWQSKEQLRALELAEPEKFAELEAVSLARKVSRHMLLPNEVPLINTVKDVKKLQSEPFYARASEGDKVLVFSTRAILYNPVSDRIVEVGFIRKFTPTPVAEGTASDSAQATVAGVASSSGTVLIDNERFE